MSSHNTYDPTVSASADNAIAVPAGVEQTHSFKLLQEELKIQFEQFFPDPLARKTVVVVPSLSLDPDFLSRIEGIVHYEERLLCLLLLLRMPHTHLIYVTSTPIDPVIIDYYLHLLPGISGYHARQRLTLLSCYDSSSKPLTEKLLERPRLLRRIEEAIPSGHMAHIACFNVSPLEAQLALRLQIPVYGCDPDLFALGNKSNSRKLFRRLGLKIPDGYEDVYTETGIAEALMALKLKYPELKRAVVKMNDGFSGEGNGIFYYETGGPAFGMGHRIKSQLPRSLQIVAPDLTYSEFIQKFSRLGGVVEVFVEGVDKHSPSAQCRIDPLGTCDVLSTHDQELGGESGQVFTGAYFPARSEYAVPIGEMGLMVTKALCQQGVLGRLSIDFLSVREGTGWAHYALEINIRKGGTTHPFLMLQYLTDGRYDHRNGIFHTANGLERCYFATDNLKHPKFKGLTPHDLVEISMKHHLMYDSTTQEGVMFHLIGALSQFGKLGLVCIGKDRDTARALYHRTIEVLLAESD